MRTFSDILFGKGKEIEKQFICRLNKNGVYTWGKHLNQLSDSEKIDIANFLIADIPNVILRFDKQSKYSRKLQKGKYEG